MADLAQLHLRGNPVDHMRLPCLFLIVKVDDFDLKHEHAVRTACSLDSQEFNIALEIIPILSFNLGQRGDLNSECPCEIAAAAT
jgi:hypothetical protein